MKHRGNIWLTIYDLSDLEAEPLALHSGGHGEGVLDYVASGGFVYWLAGGRLYESDPRDGSTLFMTPDDDEPMHEVWSTGSAIVAETLGQGKAPRVFEPSLRQLSTLDLPSRAAGCTILAAGEDRILCVRSDALHILRVVAH